MGVKEKNQEKILRMLRCHGALSVNSVMKSLKLSEPSVRRYFAEMERCGLLLRYHGGVRLSVDKANTGYQFYDAVSSSAAEKHLIGMMAAEQIVSHDRLFFDSGTTALECGNALAERLSAGSLSDLRIVSNSLAFATGLTPLCPVTLTGGTIRLARMDLCGSVALENVLRYNFTKAILGTDAIAPDGTLSTTDEETASLVSAVISRSSRILILADSSKLGKNSFVPYGNLSDERITLITDAPSDVEILDSFRKQGIKLITGPSEKNLIQP